MHHHLYERIEEILRGDPPPVVTLQEMVGWVDLRDGIVMSYEAAVDALRRLHTAGRLAAVAGGYAAPGAGAEHPFSPPTRAEYDAAVAAYRASMARVDEARPD